MPDVEKIKEFLASEEGIAAIAAAAEKQVDGLKTKNDELLGKLGKFKHIDPEMYEQLVEFKKEIDEGKRQKLLDDGDSEKIIEQMKSDHAKEIEKLTGERDGLSEENRKLIVSQSLSEAMSQAEIAGPYQEAFLALIGSKVAIADGEEGKRAVIGDKSVSDYVSEFVGTDTGKHFVKASPSTGAGATGSQTSEPGSNNPFAGDKPDLAAGGALMRSDPAKAKALMKAAGMPAAEDV